MLEACRSGCIPTSTLASKWSLLISGIETLIASTSSRSLIRTPIILGGMPAVIANFHPRELWLSIDTPIGELAGIVGQAQFAGMAISVKKEGDQFDYGGVHFHMLA